MAENLKAIKVHTIGFTKTTAQNFFYRLSNAGVKRIIDVRLNTSSQLSGFAKQNDLKYFLMELTGINYEHNSLLTPTKEILNEYKKQKGTWEKYEEKFIKLMKKREIEKHLNPDYLHETCLLCSEDTPEYCHRRLIIEYLNEHWDCNIKTCHL